MKLLFICTHNRCRSILAEAIANHVGNGRIQAFSAGSSPQQHVHPLSIHYLAERGMDVSGLNSQSWDDYANLDPDAILTLCDRAAAETCPIWFTSSVQVHWGLADPSSGQLSDDERGDKFSKTMTILERRIKTLMQDGNLTLRGEGLKQRLQSIAEQIH